MKILDGKKCAVELRHKLKTYLQKNSDQPTPGLAIISVGQNAASEIYVRNKNKAAHEVGIKTFNYILDESVSLQDIVTLINKLNATEYIHGILVQMPLPKKFNRSMVNTIIEAINPAKDVDGFHPANLGHLFINDMIDSDGHQYPTPCTPQGILYLLNEYDIDITGKNVVIIGRSNIVGRPLAALLTNLNATVTLTHSRTKELSKHTKMADIIIVAVGKPNFLTNDMIKSDAIIVDVGINKINGKLIGDVDKESVSESAQYLTPVPGGIGPMTVVTLLKQVVMLAKQQSWDVK